MLIVTPCSVAISVVCEVPEDAARSSALERRVEPLGPQLEVSLLVEDLAQQRQDCGACTRAGVATRRLSADVREITVEAIEALERARRVRIALQALELRLASCDELAGERSVAIQGRSGPATALVRLELERNLRSRRERRGEMPCGRLDDLRERGLKLG